jgi:hypothetical protein
MVVFRCIQSDFDKTHWNWTKSAINKISAAQSSCGQSSTIDWEQMEERKFIQDLLFLACLNHNGGFFTVDLRLQKYVHQLHAHGRDHQKHLREILRSHLAMRELTKRASKSKSRPPWTRCYHAQL